MTTIAFKAGVLAADTLLVSASHHRCGYAEKIKRAPTGELLALTGFAPTAYGLMDWWLAGHEGQQPNFDEGGSLIVFDKDGADIFCSGGRQREANAPFFAYGSGAQFALAAMDLGAGAKAAVGVAAKFCIYTGGDITVLSL